MQACSAVLIVGMRLPKTVIGQKGLFVIDYFLVAIHFACCVTSTIVRNILSALNEHFAIVCNILVLQYFLKYCPFFGDKAGGRQVALFGFKFRKRGDGFKNLRGLRLGEGLRSSVITIAYLRTSK